jgi:hypothetical protein
LGDLGLIADELSASAGENGVDVSESVEAAVGDRLVDERP